MDTQSATEPPPPPRADSIWPREFGRYILLSPLAQGGMGDVCLALVGELSTAQRLCVVKTVRNEYARDRDFIGRFLDEGRVLCALTHPNIGQILEVGQEALSQSYFVAMEHVAGIDLDALIYAARSSGHHLPMDFVLTVTAGVLDGMSFAHRASTLDGTPLKLVHRDISPQNIRMSWEGDVKVLDFGTAHATGRGIETVHGLVFGKPGYMSPEQARGEKVDARSDLFAIGIVMWELMSDRDFAVAEPAEHMECLAVGSYSFVPPSRLRGDAPRDLDRWLETMTAFKAEDRYPDAATARRTLVDIAAARGIRFDREVVARTLSRFFPNDREVENDRVRRLVAQSRAVRPEAPSAPPPRPTTEPLPTSDVNMLRGTRYRVGEKLGSGGMGEVYAAEHIDLGRKVALKVLYADRSNDPAVVQRFKLEARSIAALEHPNLVQVFEFGSTEDGRLFYAMERLYGETLRERTSHGATLPDKRLPPEECVRVGAAIARGLEAVHKADVVHRDIKPENIFLTREGEVKLLDFGVAKTNNAELLAGDNPGTRAGEIFGSPAYMSPEQAKGGTVDPRTDIYALGAVLYECVTGSTLFQGATMVETLTQQITRHPTAPHVRAPDADIPDALETVILRCLVKDPNGRFASAGELAQALEACLGGDATLIEASKAALAAAAITQPPPPLDAVPRSPSPRPPPNGDDESDPALRPAITEPRRAVRTSRIVVWTGVIVLLFVVGSVALGLRLANDHTPTVLAGNNPSFRVRPDPSNTPAIPAPGEVTPTRPEPTILGPNRHNAAGSHHNTQTAISPVPNIDPGVQDAGAPVVQPSTQPSVVAAADAGSSAPTQTPNYHYTMAQRRFREGNYPAAIGYAEQAISNRQGGLGAHVLLGRAFILNGERQRGVERLQLVLRRDPTNRQARDILCATDACPE